MKKYFLIFLVILGFSFQAFTEKADLGKHIETISVRWRNFKPEDENVKYIQELVYDIEATGPEYIKYKIFNGSKYNGKYSNWDYVLWKDRDIDNFFDSFYGNNGYPILYNRNEPFIRAEANKIKTLDRFKGIDNVRCEEAMNKIDSTCTFASMISYNTLKIYSTGYYPLNQACEKDRLTIKFVYLTSFIKKQLISEKGALTQLEKIEEALGKKYKKVTVHSFIEYSEETVILDYYSESLDFKRPKTFIKIINIGNKWIGYKIENTENALLEQLNQKDLQKYKVKCR